MMELNDRAKAFEKKFVNDNELEFHARMRAFRRLIRWVAEDQLELNTEDAQAFCDKMILIMVRNPDQEAFFADIQNRLKDNHIQISVQELQSLYQKNLATAFQELKSDN